MTPFSASRQDIALMALVLLAPLFLSSPTSSSASAAPPPPGGDNCSAQCTCTVEDGCGGELSATLPNVMLLSDSIGANKSGYFTNVRALLGANGDPVTGAGAVGNAVVHHVGGYGRKICGTSFGAAACVDQWMQGKKFDVIHYNWGLHDICAKMYAPVTPEQYSTNMEIMYQKMKAHLKPAGTLIWSTTTPVPPSYRGRVNSDVLRINAQMAALFGPNGTHPDVVVSDMYAAVVKRCNNIAASKGYPQSKDCDFLQSRGVHFSDTGKEFTAIVAAGAIAPFL